MTVTLASVAAAIAFAVARSATNEAQTGGNRLSAQASLREAQGVLGGAESQLLADPLAPLSRVLVGENARVCASDAATVSEPGDSWPRSCSTWSYRAPQTTPNTRFEITTPSPTDTHLTLTALSRHGDVDGGYTAKYALVGGGKWVWASVGAADFSTAAPSQSATISGSIYAVGTIDLPASGGVSLTDTLVATESGYSQPPNGVGGSWFGGGQGDVRTVQPNPVRYGTLTTATEIAHSVGCPDATMTNLAASVYVSNLCFLAGVNVPRSDGTIAMVPATTTAYMLVLGDGFVNVYATSAPFDTSTSSALTCANCSLPDLAGSKMIAGTHPGQLSWWEQSGVGLLGQFRLPANGVIAFDGDVSIGYCSDAGRQYALGQQCALALGSSTPGMTAHQSLTVVAGSAAHPRDIVIGSPIGAIDGVAIGLVATDQVIFPYFSRPHGHDLSVQAHLLAAGLNDPSRPSVEAFPLSLPFSGALDTNWGQALRVVGSVTGVQLPIGVSGFTSVEYSPDSSATSGAAPWFAGLDATWVKTATERISGFDVCAQRTCGGAGKETVNQQVLPATAILCAPSTTEATCSWTPSSTVGVIAPNGYKITINGVERWAGTTTTAVIPTLLAGTSYQVVVVAVGANGDVAAAPVDVLTLPACPSVTLSAVSASDDTMNLVWGAVQSAEEYKVYVDGSLIAAANVTATTYIDANGSANALRSYTVTSTNASGSSTGCGSVSSRFGPQSPTLNPITRSGATYSASWSLGVGATTWNAQVERGTAGTLSRNVTGLLVPSISYSDVDISAIYRVRAQGVNSNGAVGPWSAWGAWSNSSAPACPSVTTTLDSTSPHTTVLLAWAAVVPATAYKVYIDGVLQTTINATSYTDTTGSANVSRAYLVTGVSSAESSGCITKTVRFGPGAPTLVGPVVTGTSYSGTFSGGAGALSWLLEIEKNTSGSTSLTQLSVSVGSFQFDNNAFGARYRYRARAINTSGQSGPWAAWTAYSAYTSPACPVATANTVYGTSDSIAVSWTALVAASGYKVFVGSSLTPAVQTSGLSWMYTGGTPNATVAFTVVATNSSGQSTLCGSTSALVPPGVPTLDLMTTVGTTANGSWVGGLGALNWNVEVEGLGIGLVFSRINGTNTVSFDGATLSGFGTKYRMRTQAVSRTLVIGAWSPWGAWSPCTITDAPTLSDLTTASSPTSINAIWAAPLLCPTSVLSYEVGGRLAPNGQWVTLASGLNAQGPNAATITVPSSGLYDVRIRSVNGAGASAWSNVRTIATVAPPNAPSVSSVTSSQAATVTVSLVAPTNTGGSAIVDYDLEYSTDPLFNAGDGTFVEAGFSSSTVLVVPGLTDGLVYYFRARSTNGAGDSSWSDLSAPAVPVSTPQCSFVGVASRTTNSFLASWAVGTTGGSAITANLVEWKEVGEFVWQAASVAAVDTSFLITGLTAGVQYNVRVSPSNAAGISTAPCTSVGWTIAEPPTFTTVTNTQTTITVNWLTVLHATGYQVSRIGGPTAQLTQTSNTDTGLATCTTYSYQLRAIGPWGMSAFSTVYSPRTQCSITYQYAPVVADEWRDQSGFAGVASDITLGYNNGGAGYGDFGFNPEAPDVVGGVNGSGHWHYATGWLIDYALAQTNLATKTPVACSLTGLISKTAVNAGFARFEVHGVSATSLSATVQATLGLPDPTSAWVGTIDTGNLVLPVSETVSTINLAGLNCNGFKTGALTGLMVGPNMFALASSFNQLDNVAYTGAILVAPTSLLAATISVTANW